MSETKNSQVEMDSKEAVQVAEELEQAVGAASDVGVYTHLFKTPFSYGGHTFDVLSFDWGSLTGNDSLAIENEMLARGKTLVIPAYTGEYLVGMAAHACTERGADDRRIVGTDTIRALPLGDFHRICNKARNFLLRAGR